MATLEELRRWSFGGAAAEGRGTALPAGPLFRAMAYRFAPREHPELRGEYRAAAMRDLPLTLELQRIRGRFRAAGIRFAPIKGADLAYRCYPDPVLRQRCDIDLLIHPDDLDRAVEIAVADHWRMPHRFRHGYHVPGMYKKHAMLELHFNLPEFPDSAARRLWELFSREGDSSEYRLPPELSLAVAFLHARRHRWNNRAALIADYAFLLAKHPGFDWARARDLAREFGTGDPGLLCFALPELFPREVLPPGPVPDAGVLRALREVTLAEFDLKEHRESDVLSRADRFSRAWWRGRFAGFLPEVVRFRYRLPDDAGPGRMFRAYCRMCGDKAKLLWIGVFRRDRAVSGALRAAGEIERYLNERSDETSPERNG